MLADDDLEIDLFEAPNFAGETLIVTAADVGASAARVRFDEAKNRLVTLLRDVRWPQRIAWVDETRIVSFPGRVFVFLPHGQFQAEAVSRARYEAAAADNRSVRLGAVGVADGITLAAVWDIRELAQGEEMFFDHGVKIDVPADEPRVTITSSLVRWLFIRVSYRWWKRRRDAALRR